MTDSNKAKKEMDLDVALSHVDGDIQFLAEFAELFLQDYPLSRKHNPDATIHDYRN